MCQKCFEKSRSRESRRPRKRNGNRVFTWISSRGYMERMSRSSVPDLTSDRTPLQKTTYGIMHAEAGRKHVPVSYTGTMCMYRYAKETTVYKILETCDRRESHPGPRMWTGVTLQECEALSRLADPLEPSRMLPAAVTRPGVYARHKKMKKTATFIARPRPRASRITRTRPTSS